MPKKKSSQLRSENKGLDLTLVAAVTLIIGVSAFLIYRSRITSRISYLKNQAYMSAQRQKVVSITLSEQNKSGQSGKATLKEVNGKVVVNVYAPGGAKGVSQPAHIHKGTCENMGEVVYPLTNVLNGNSDSTLDTGFAMLFGGTEYSLNIHKSSAQSGVYTACGNLPLNY